MNSVKRDGMQFERNGAPCSNRNTAICFIVLFCLLPVFFCQTFVKSSALRAFLIVIALIMVLYCAGRGSWRLSFNKPTLALLVFFLMCLTSGIVSTVGGYGWFIYFGIVLIMGVLLKASSAIDWIEFFFLLLAAFGLFYALVTILCWVFPPLYDNVIYPLFFSNIQTIVGKGYKSGFTSHYSTNGMYLALGLLGCFCLTLKNVRQRAWQLAFLVVLVALLLTTKRAHLVFGIVSIVVAYMLFGSGKSVSTTGKLLLAAAFLLLAFFFAQFLNPDLGAVVDRIVDSTDDDSFGGRASFYDLCIQMWQENPLFGNGWDSYTETFNRTVLGMRYAASGFTTMDAHNVYYQVLAEQGLVGLALLVAAMLGFLVSGIRALLEINKTKLAAGLAKERALLAGAISVQVFFALYCITGNPLYDMQMYIPWLLSCAVSVQLSSQIRNLLNEKQTRMVVKHT